MNNTIMTTVKWKYKENNTKKQKLKEKKKVRPKLSTTAKTQLSTTTPDLETDLILIPAPIIKHKFAKVE